MDVINIFNGDTCTLKGKLMSKGVPLPIPSGASIYFAARDSFNSPKYAISPKRATITNPEFGEFEIYLTTDETSRTQEVIAELEFRGVNTVKTVWQGSIVFNKTIIE